MRDFIKNWAMKIWGFVVIVAIPIGILGSYESISPWFKHKAISFDVISSNSINPDIDGLSLILGGRALPNLQLRTVRIMNSGDIPINSVDFYGPIKVIFQDGEIIKSSIIYENPSNLGLTYASVGKNGVAIAPLLLNPGDFFDMQITTTRAVVEPRVFARIAGVKEIVHAERQPRYGMIARDLFLAIVGLLAYSLVGDIFVRRLRSGSGISIIEYLVIIIGLALLSGDAAVDAVHDFGAKTEDHAFIFACCGGVVVMIYVYRCMRVPLFGKLESKD